MKIQWNQYFIVGKKSAYFLKSKNTVFCTSKLIISRFNISSLFLQNTQTSCLYSSAETTGFVCDYGENNLYTSPIYEGYCLPHAFHKFINCGGKYIRENLSKIILDRFGKELNPLILIHHEILNDIIKNHCFVRDFRDSISRKNEVVRYELPCGNILELDEEILTKPIECLLRKKVTKRKFFVYGEPDEFEIIEAAYNSIRRTDVDIREELFRKIYLCGGTVSSFPGILERTKQAISNAISMNLVVDSSINRERIVNVGFPIIGDLKYCAFVGSSMLGEYGEFGGSNSFVTKEIYDEHGPNIVYRRAY